MKKGFTLIELLAVIVILAIIALIATPIVLDIIESTNKSAKERSLENYLDSVEQAVATAQLNGKVITSGTYSVMNTGDVCLVTPTNGTCPEEETLTVKTNGDVEYSNSVNINNGLVDDSDIKIVENAENKLVMSVMLTKEYNEEENLNYVYATINFVSNPGTMTLIGNLKYNPEKLTYSKYSLGVSNDYLITPYGEDLVITSTAESMNKRKTGMYATIIFTTDNLDSITASDFTYYIMASNWKQQNVLVEQDETSDIVIENNNVVRINAVKDSSEDYAPGDINNDGYVDNIDLAALKKFLLMGGDSCKAMDVNADGSINTLDMIHLKKYISYYEDVTVEYSPMTGIPGHL